MSVFFSKKNTTGSVRCGRGERKDTDGIKAEGVYGNGNGNFFSIRKNAALFIPSQSCAFATNVFFTFSHL